MKRFWRISVLIILAVILLLWLLRSREVASVAAKAAPIKAPIAAPKPAAEILPAQKAVEAKPPPVSAPEPEVSVEELAARAQLHEALTDMISLLEANNAADYILKYTPPEELALSAAHFAAEGITLEQSLKPLRGRPLLPGMQAILEEMKNIQDTTPHFNKNLNKAEYAIDPTLSAKLYGHPKKIYFQKIDGKWYGGN